VASISFVIPVRNGAPWIEAVLLAVLREAEGHEFEIVIIEDGSADDSPRILKSFGDRLRVVAGDGGGAARAINLGLREARHPLIAQLDQDVRIQPGWLSRLLAELEDPEVAAAQGHYVPDERASLWERVMGLDLAQRYAQPEKFVDHVCTGNTLYRAEALARVGYLDETLGYGYDNDLSYRLHDAGYKLVRCREARSVHYWRDTFFGYFTQQYGMGYGRIDLVFKHRGRYRGDDVSGRMMMMHAPLLGLALFLFALACAFHFPAFWLGAASVFSFLVVERAVSGVIAWKRFGEPAGLWFPPVHLVRDSAWLLAIAIWSVRRLFSIRGKPQHSMAARSLTEKATGSRQQAAGDWQFSERNRTEENRNG
jgi:GT2 family glycosyltransferase